LDQIAVVIPCYRVARQITGVIERIGDKVSWIICVVDGCPENTGEILNKKQADDSRIEIINHGKNKGVGASVITGYLRALELGASIIVKLDGDGQMDPEQISRLVAPIVQGEADYTKGNRFFSPESISEMPAARIIANAAQSFWAKLSSGYWNVFDPANGFTAIHAKAVALLPLKKISKRYFFETDMLFRLSTIRATVIDVPMAAHYGDEKSSLSMLHSLLTFPFQHLANLVKRIVYCYFIRDFNIATVNLFLGMLLNLFGVVYGINAWSSSFNEMQYASAGTVMLAGLPIIVGFQLLLNFLAYDMANQPTAPIHRKL
jgi:dolichol-phosphate mannosyltransferase